jgi:hypothetical protein
MQHVITASSNQMHGFFITFDTYRHYKLVTLGMDDYNERPIRR